jgi:hypothetical protein
MFDHAWKHSDAAVHQIKSRVFFAKWFTAGVGGTYFARAYVEESP